MSLGEYVCIGLGCWVFICIAFVWALDVAKKRKFNRDMESTARANEKRLARLDRERAEAQANFVSLIARGVSAGVATAPKPGHCKNCGVELAKDAKFCSRCGTAA
jgi:predicted Zn-ribbon and HTH transcriptional regulator